MAVSTPTTMPAQDLADSPSAAASRASAAAHKYLSCIEPHTQMRWRVEMNQDDRCPDGWYQPGMPVCKPCYKAICSTSPDVTQDSPHAG